MGFADDLNWSSTDIDEVNVPCPQCDAIFPFDAWTLVNTKENPEAVAKIIDGTLFEFRCPKCGYEAHLAQPCLFVDPDKCICIYSVIDEGMAQQAEAMFADPDSLVAAYSKCRIVRGRKELAERVLCFDNCLDDRAIELLKFGIRGSVRMQGLSEANEDIQVRLEAVEGEGLTFGVEFAEDSFVTTMEMRAYELFDAAIQRSSIANKQPLYVDQTWGDHAFDVIKAEGALG